GTPGPDQPAAPHAKDPGQRPTWALRAALDSDTLQLGIQLDFDHMERRPDVRPGPGTPAAGTPTVHLRHDTPRDKQPPREDPHQPPREGDEMDHRPTWALKVPPALPSQRPASTPVPDPSEELSPEPAPAPRASAPEHATRPASRPDG
ncbi:hypothetical protein P8605_36880, partial [Streptomyces sp. T-3]|nr:hypothetical protein [Streptomyces sp. T-3]